MSKSISTPPREGTRRAAVWEFVKKCCNGFYDWEAQDVYTAAGLPSSYPRLEVNRLLKEWCVQTESGYYRMKPELASEHVPGYSLKLVPNKSDKITAGCWVRLKRDQPNEDALYANGLRYEELYEVVDARGPYVYFENVIGGWLMDRFEICDAPTDIEKPLKEQPSPRNDKGAPEFRDMAWGSMKVITYDPPKIDEWESKYKNLRANVESWHDSAIHAVGLVQQLSEVTVESLPECIGDLEAHLSGLETEIGDALGEE